MNSKRLFKEKKLDNQLIKLMIFLNHNRDIIHGIKKDKIDLLKELLCH